MTDQPSALRRIPIKLIDPSPFGIRREKHLNELDGSVKKFGIESPIMVREKGKRFEVVYGDRRLAEAKRLGLREVDAIIVKADDKESLLRHVIENCARRDFDAMEEAEAYTRLKLQGYATERIAKLVGKSPPHVSNRLSLLKLPEVVQENIRNGKIPATLGIHLSHMVPRAMQSQVAETILTQKFDYLKSLQYLHSLEQTFKEDRIREKYTPPDPVSEKKRQAHLEEKKQQVEEKLKDAFGVDAVNVIYLEFWQLLLESEPKLAIYRVLVKRTALIEALETDLRELKAKAAMVEAVAAVSSAKQKV